LCRCSALFRPSCVLSLVCISLDRFPFLNLAFFLCYRAMLTIPTGLGAPGIIEGGGAPYSNNNAARRRRSSHRTAHQRRDSPLIAGKRSSSAGRENVAEINGISMDRLTYMNTALDALPGFALREFFVPVMRLKKQLLLRQRRTRERFPPVGSAAYTESITGAVAALAKSLSSAAADLALDGGTSGLDVDPKGLAECLQSKLSPVCMEAGGVLGYPREPPEASFVYIVLSGTVTAMYFQPQPLPPQQRRTGGGGGGRKERQTYFTSAKDVVRLCGGGAVPDAALLLDDYNGTDPGAALETTSMSNVTTAIQRSLRRASRTVGQPTLQYTRMEQLRGPVVLGAAEALGLAPCKYVSYTASTEPSGPVVRGNNTNKIDDVEVVQAFRVRTADVHAALIQLAAVQHAERQGRTPLRFAPWCAAPAGEVVPRGSIRTIADFIVAARRNTLYNDYAAMELMMRQSWLLQDAPSHTIRTLIAHLEPHTYMPGEVIACPHTPGGERQLCFLRRGRLNVYTAPKKNTSAAGAAPGGEQSASNVSMHANSPPPCSTRDECECWLTTSSATGARPAEVVESGASFGELSVLFQEPRNCVLRADTVCDAWCLPHRSFTSLMQRDASLRDGLLQKAAVLRIEWMSEQRFTRTLAQQLRTSSELLHPLPDIAIRLIQERLEPVVYAPGSLVVSTSTKCNEVIFIMHGSVSSVCQGVATYGPGDVLGEGCLVPHRWPLGLAARTMVEGWRIKADQLSDALRRMERLHQYSGLVTSQTSQLMKQIFGTPQPEIEVDAVGRQRMPTVGAAPGGKGYLAYGRAVSEVQLRATCFLYRDYVRWEDINYSTIDDTSCATRRAKRHGALLDTLARELAIQRLVGGKGKPVADALAQQQQQQATTPGQRQNAAALVGTESPAGKEIETGTEVTAAVHKGTSAAGSGRNAVRASSGMSSRSARAGAPRAQRSRVSSAGAFLVKGALLSDEADLLSSSTTGASRVAATTATTTAAGSARGKLIIPLPPRLQRMKRLLEERNRTWAAEQRHEATLVQQEASQREAAVRDQVALHASAVAAAGRRPSSRGRAEGRTSAASARAPSPHLFLADVSPAPVHIFLQCDKPKYELDLREAISIGYVMQLPDITHIQYSVSLVDPDIALGPPAQRARRHLMSITPNDRYNKHNFLFAAASLEGGSSAESQKAAAEAAADAMLRSKARRLYTMMRTAVAARMDAEADQINSTPHRNTSGEYSPDNDSVGTHPPDTLMLSDALHVRSPKDDAEGLVRSPPISHQTPFPPQRTQQQEQHHPLLCPPAVRAGSVATPSPFRGSPSKNSAQRSDEALQRVLQRDPVQAIDLLRKHYGVPWAHGSASGGGGVTSGQSSPARYTTESRSMNGSGYLSANMEASGESQRRAYRPSLLDRLETAAAGGPTASPSGLPRVLPSCDGFNGDSRSNSSGGGAGGDVEESLASGEVLLTNNNAPTFPSLMFATARDRWHGGNHLTPSSAPPAGRGDGLAAAATVNRGDEGGGASGGAAAVPEGGTLCDYFYSGIRRRYSSVLFVEGYGPLQPLSGEWIEYPPTIHVAAAAVARPDDAADGAGDSGSVDRAGAPANGSRVSRPASAVAAAAALRRSASRPGNNTSSSPFRAGGSVGGHGFNSPSGAFGGQPSTTAVPPMEPFVMPTLEDTEVVIRRIQRDVNGLNAVAREQRRERDVARLRNGRIVKHRAAVAAALGKPDEQERELLEMWRDQLARIDHDPLRRASVPAALSEEGGPDYMKRELRVLANAPVPMEDPLWRYTKDMQVWQEQQQHGGRLNTSPFHGTSLQTVSAGGGSALDGPRQVVAAIGTSRLGFAPTPLQNPTALMTAADSQAWVNHREDFFAAYKELLEHPGTQGGGGASVLALAAPTLRFTPAPPSTSKATTTHPPLQGGRGASETMTTVTHSSSDHTPYTAAFADRTTSPLASGGGGHISNNCDAGEEEEATPFRQSSTSNAAVQSVGSAASILSVPSPLPAMEDSADLVLRRPRQELPARYDETPLRSNSAEAQVTPLAADHRVPLTPPRDSWNADNTPENVEGSDEYSSEELEEEEEEEKEEEGAHSAVLGGPDMAESSPSEDSSGDIIAAAAAAAAVVAAANEAPSSSLSSSSTPGEKDDDEAEELTPTVDEEGADEGIEEKEEEEDAPGAGEDEAKEEEKDDRPAWLDL
jgi:CRP-like cAMP-binding protein